MDSGAVGRFRNTLRRLVMRHKETLRLLKSTPTSYALVTINHRIRELDLSFPDCMLMNQSLLPQAPEIHSIHSWQCRHGSIFRAVSGSRSEEHTSELQSRENLV